MARTVLQVRQREKGNLGMDSRDLKGGIGCWDEERITDVFDYTNSSDEESPCRRGMMEG